MEQAFFTKKELATRWKCSPATVDSLVKSGALTPVRKLPGWLVRASDVYALEETELDPLSPLERLRLQREIDRLTSENLRLRGDILDIAAIVTKFLRGEVKDDTGSKQERSDSQKAG